MKSLARTACFLLLLLATTRAHGAIYFVSPTGNDGNSGLATGDAWKTIARANAHSFVAGDQLLFQAGNTFAGTVYFGPSSPGTPANPIWISSYGAGRATINGGNTNAIFAYNCGGLVISNLNVVGSGRLTNKNSGIEFYNDGGGAARMLEFVRVSNVDASGFGFVGVTVGSWNGTNAYLDVRLTRIDAHDNANIGISSYAEFPNLHSNVYVGDCRSWNNPGTAGDTGNTGNGIVLGNVNTALIERCVAWTNGWIGNAAVGIWCYDSTRVTIQFCESHHNRTSGASDGGGFDLDGGATYCVMQYNYSHDNDGAGYGLYQYSGAPAYSNNVVRFNISQDDGRKNGYGGISLWNGGSGVNDVHIYNNTVFVSTAPSGTARAIYFLTAVNNVRFRNNCLITTNGLRLVDGPSSGQTGVLFQGNNYWSSGGAFAIRWGSSTHSTLAAWRGAGHEKIATTNVGLNVNPQLLSAGGGGTLGDPALLPALVAYQLNVWSPLRDAGLNLAALFDTSIGPQDFYGNTVPSGLAPDIGAHDAQIAVMLSSPRIENGFFTTVYQRGSPLRTDLEYRPELSSDFANWCTNCAVPIQTNLLGDGSERVTLRETAPAGATPRFLRLRARRL